MWSSEAFFLRLGGFQGLVTGLPNTKEDTGLVFTRFCVWDVFGGVRVKAARLRNVELQSFLFDVSCHFRHCSCLFVLRVPCRVSRRLLEKCML